MNLKTISLDKLNPAPYNPRTITDDEFNGLCESLKTFGQQENLIVNKDMTIISGHQRYEAMKFLNWSEATCNVVDLDKHAEKKLNVIMNSTAISGKYDDLKLAEILEELKLDDDYESLRLDVLEPLDLSEVEVEEDEAPEVSSEPAVSKLGEVYQLGRHRIMCGDSTDKANVELLMNGDKADMVFTDPPYGMDLDTDFENMSQRSNKVKGVKYDRVIGDDKPFKMSDFHWIDAVEQFWWGADYYHSELPTGGSWFVWDKRIGVIDDALGNMFELCWSKTHHRREIIRKLWFGVTAKEHGETRSHPTQKPIELCAWFIKKFGKDGWVVLDLFGGSGSTLIACEQTDRICYGMELDPKYVDVIRKRYWKFTHDGNEEGWEEGTPSV